jgi:hypothetical protein
MRRLIGEHGACMSPHQVAMMQRRWTGGESSCRAAVLGEGLSEVVQETQSMQAARGDGELRVEFVQEPGQFVSDGRWPMADGRCVERAGFADDRPAV